MTATTLRRTSRIRQRDEARSVLAVVVVVAIALVAGLVLRMSVENAVRPVAGDGVDAAVPAGWVVLPPAGDRLLTAYDPVEPDLRYAVAVVDGSAAENSLAAEDAAARRLADRRQLLDSFTILSERPGAIGSVATYDVRYTFVDPVPGGTPTTIESIEHYLPDGRLFPEERVLVIALEATPDTIEAARPGFERFSRELALRTDPTSARLPEPAPSDARLASIGGWTPPRGGAPTATADLVKATVQIYITATIAGREQPVGWGSGTIISKDGLILTNAHVAMPSAPGLGVYESDPTPPVDPEDLVVAMVGAEDEPAVPTYRATVIAADGYLDAAVIRIDRDFEGRRVQPSSLDLPTVPIGDSNGVRVGDDLTVVGFPGIGGNTLSLSSGRVSGFLGDERIGPRAWIKTDAVISQGNSGGLAANAAGELIGVPTRAPRDAGGYSQIRPVALLTAVLDAGRAGRRTVESPHLVPSTGRERLTFESWTDTFAACPPANGVSSFPSNTREIVASMSHAGFASGEDMVSQWRLDGELIYRSGRRLDPGSEAGGCLLDSIYHDRGLPDGSYVVEVFAGPRLKPVLTAQTTVGSAVAGATSLSGRVVDADSGRPIARAVVFMLTPGTDPLAWRAAPTEAQVVAYAQTVSDGTFTLLGLQTGTAYPALAVAEGYVAAHGTIGPLADGRNELVSPITLTRAS
ncbi:MAG TPA: trypsin-like peptidase domain-containing protein [Candidatus Limnocylindrales bacterium]